MTGVVVLTSVSPPLTTTVSSRPPTSSEALSAVGMPGCSRTSSSTAVLKPGNDTLTEYKPGLSAGTANAPVPSVTALNVAVVDLLVTTTDAPGITAPAESTTVPESVDVTCENATEEKHSTTSTAQPSCVSDFVMTHPPSTT